MLAHEVSVHLLTYFNGAAQGLTIFRTGLAGYEGIQEGLGVFAEWASGGLTRTPPAPARRRAWSRSRRCSSGADFIDVYRALARDHGFSRRGAFGIAARVFRSGGLAKDAIYLRGFRDGHGPGRVRARRSSPSGLARSPPRHAPAIEELLQRGLVQAPRFIPLFLPIRGAQDRIARLRAAEASRRSVGRSLSHVLIAFFVNDMEREYPGYTTTVLAHQAAERGHRVCYVTPADFMLGPTTACTSTRRFLPKKKYKDREEFFEDAELGNARPSQLDMAEVDVLMLRNDPSLDAQRRRGRPRSASCSAGKRRSAA